MIAHVLLNEPITVVAANDRVGQFDIFDHGLKLAAIKLGELAPEDGGDLVRLPDSTIGVEQALAEAVEGGTTAEDEIVAVLHLRKEQPMLTAGLAAFFLAEEGGEGGKPFLRAHQQIAASQRVGQLLQARGLGTAEESVGALLERDSFLPQTVGQPVVLIEADAGRERKIGTHAHEHASPAAVVDIEVVLHDPALGELQMPAVVLRFADGDDDACRLARLEDYYDLIRFGSPEVRRDELVAAAGRGFDDRRTPLERAVLDPVVELLSHTAQ